jgi:hypothetical protein
LQLKSIKREYSKIEQAKRKEFKDKCAIKRKFTGCVKGTIEDDQRGVEDFVDTEEELKDKSNIQEGVFEDDATQWGGAVD